LRTRRRSSRRLEPSASFLQERRDHAGFPASVEQPGCQMTWSLCRSVPCECRRHSKTPNSVIHRSEPSSTLDAATTRSLRTWPVCRDWPTQTAPASPRTQSPAGSRPECLLVMTQGPNTEPEPAFSSGVPGERSIGSRSHRRGSIRRGRGSSERFRPLLSADDYRESPRDRT
jgi:hypothetical protein